MKIPLIRRTLPGITATVALMVAIATAASAGSTGPLKTSARPMAPSASSPKEEMVSRLIVKPRAQADAKLAIALQSFDASGLSKTANVPLTVFRPMSGDAHVIKLDRPVTLSEARVIAERLMRNDSSVEYAEPDIRVYPTATTPADPGYVNQWHYFAPAGTNLGGADLPDAWDVTQGSASITVAVIDTGYRQHVDLGPVLPGYDFIDNTMMANDGGGRDSDAQDPGDWVAADECEGGNFADNSSWHGTHVAGTIAALMNNGIGGTGIAPNVKILPVRVLGKCGGNLSDIADGMRWAAGLAVPGVPVNPNPAHVLNMSLGAAYPCSPAFQSAADNVIDAGKAIVAATGNNGTTFVGEPANCDGVIAVTAHTIDGENAWYADIGTMTTISAPGGDASLVGVYSLSNTGTTVPVADTYAEYSGTSMATPHVAGVVALMLSVKPSLTPAQVKSYLQSSARAFPTGSICITIYPGMCGSGLLDAAGALNTTSAAPPTVVIMTPSQVVSPNATVSLSGSATAEPPRTIKSYLWTQLTGATVVGINNADTANATFTSPATGAYSFLLTATDTTDRTGTATATARVNSAPVLTAVGAQTVTEGNALDFSVGATDVDGDTPIFHSISLPTGATLSPQGALNWASATPTGSYTMTYYASDALGANSAQGTVDITVTSALPPNSSGGDGGGGCLSITRSGGGMPSGTSLFSIGILFLPSCALGLRRFFRRRERTVPVRHPLC
jgi:serine protease